MADLVKLLVLCMCLCASASASAKATGTQYVVGDEQRWDFGVDYIAWASTKTFHVGDTLVFEYRGEWHNVLEVEKQAYESCDTSNPIEEFRGGNNRISLTSAGTRYFICGVPAHCNVGMQLEVTVLPPTHVPKHSRAQTAPAGNFTRTSTPPSSDTAQPPQQPTCVGHVLLMRNVCLLLPTSLYVIPFFYPSILSLFFLLPLLLLFSLLFSSLLLLLLTPRLFTNLSLPIEPDFRF